MKPLLTNQRVLTWLCMHHDDENSSNFKKIAYIAFSRTVATINMCNLISNFAFSLGFEMENLELYLFSFLNISGEVGIIYIMMVGLFSRDRIGGIFEKLLTIYNDHKNEETFRFLAEANNNSEWMWSIYFKYLIWAFVSTAMMAVNSVITCWYKYGQFDVDLLYHPQNLVLPWNRTTKMGYFGELCFALITSESYLIVSGAFLLLFISVCQHHQAFLKMFNHSIENWNSRNKHGNIEPFIRNLMRFHITSKDWFLDTCKVYSSIIIVQLMISTSFLVLAMFCLDLHIQKHKYDVELIILAASIGVSTLFLYCYFGQLATVSYEQINDSVYNMNWHEQPASIQRYFILMIANMQKPLYYHGFEVARLNLETFAKMVKSVITYYMMLRAITAQ